MHARFILIPPTRLGRFRRFSFRLKGRVLLQHARERPRGRGRLEGLRVRARLLRHCGGGAGEDWIELFIRNEKILSPV